ncbi:hypothetical protein HX109_15995 [Galbibacter sp. BG1]|uniref:hypothetical protein n=1 Tax=Galbibacter sp. BG1 TaxID=1170699 RepID=UPI0015B97BEF|nr:hypothetical protein [Galbibacter sp. BG1]QLE02997.1 hypothetical protein HX109_15995 [Galbibacter sp. BG1]
MVLKEIKESVSNSSNPVAKVIHQGANFKVLAIGFKKSMLLKEHTANISSKLTVLEGKVQYKEGNKTKLLNQYDEIDIPIGAPHSVEALEDSLCLLTQG